MIDLISVSSLKLGIKIAVGLISVFLTVQVIRWYRQGRAKNPFEKDARQPRKPYVTDQWKRDQVIKQRFDVEKVPHGLDAIFIGSGIGSMCSAAIMAKAGKRVLVLEQHDQAGGACHTFIDKGYEFDVGIHYIGKVGEIGMSKVLVDQITDGQLEWAEMDDEFDIVSIGCGKENRQFPVNKDREVWKANLKHWFPEEHEAIDEYFKLLTRELSCMNAVVLLKSIPLFLARIMSWLGIANKLSNMVNPDEKLSTLSVIKRLTNNKDLQTIFCYTWGDYGTPPSKSNFSMQTVITNHYSNGAFYPVGGASEIAYNIIPVIERSGGKVLVRAEVQEILHNGSKAMGVLVKKGSQVHAIEAPMIVSSAGIYNTFLNLLPKQVAQKSYMWDLCKKLTPGGGSFCIFVGLDASNEELKLKRENMWCFSGNDTDKVFDDYLNLSKEEVLEADPPLIFVSFPSAKDPNWKLHPERENKATMTAITLSNWEWFKKWEDTKLKKRGDEYEELKKTIGDKILQRCCDLYPQIRGHIDYIDIGSPVTTKHYLAQPRGEIYGLDHTLGRFESESCAKLRPETDIPGLYLTGQDILSAGFTGALMAGLITATSLLGRNIFFDLIGLTNKIKKEEREAKKYD